MNLRSPASITLLALVLFAIPVAAAEHGPQGVSPGAPDRIAHVSGACPTFSWETTPGAQLYDSSSTGSTPHR